MSRCVPRYRRCFRKQRATDAVYVAILIYLILYSILNTLYTDTVTVQPETYDLDNVAVRSVLCSYPISSQYQKTPRYICWILSILTVTVRSHKWLAAGAAASVLTYSGVAAIHLLVLSTTDNRFHPQQAKKYCQSIPVPGSTVQFLACAGIVEPDVSITTHIISPLIIGALPMAAWSTTFRQSASKAIMMFWMLLLAIGHTFYPIIRHNTNSHFQICPRDHIESLPKVNYQAPPLNDAWSQSFQSLTMGSPAASLNGSFPACLYSCFDTGGFIGRSGQNIIIAANVETTGPFIKGRSEARLAIVTFWWVYTLLALLTLFTTEKQSRLPRWVHKILYSVEFRQQPWISTLKFNSESTDVAKTVRESRRFQRDNDTTTAYPLVTAESNPIRKFQITTLKLLQFITQFSSVAAFVMGIIVDEISDGTPKVRLLEREPFAAVGQWGCVAVVMLVLFAAMISRIWAADERGGGATNIAVVESQSLQEANAGHNEEWMGIEEWDARVGYAS